MCTTITNRMCYERLSYRLVLVVLLLGGGADVGEVGQHLLRVLGLPGARLATKKVCICIAI